jgi:hypothetical protein
VSARRAPPGATPLPPSSTTLEEGGQGVDALGVARRLARQKKAPSSGQARLELGEPLTSSILTPEELAPLEAERQRRQRVAEASAELAQGRKRREAEERRRQAQAREEELRGKLEQLPRGPNLPPHKRRNAQLDVLQEDLEEALPDGWGTWWPEESERLAARIGVPPAAIPLLMILEWCFGLRPPARRSARMTAGSLSASPAWLARKVGVSERWIQALTNRLDPWASYRRERAWGSVTNSLMRARGKAGPPAPQPATGGGTAYLQRHPQLRLYKALQREVPSAARLEKWMDGSGKLHDWLDLRARWYPTVMGVRTLRRRARKSERLKAGKTPRLRRSPMQEDLYQRLAPLYRLIRARLALAFQRKFTPKDVQLSRSNVSTAAPTSRAGPDPPEGSGAPRAQRRGALQERPQGEPEA